VDHPNRLRGQAVIVMGASSGMGRATAAAFARAGARVLAAARRGGRLQELQHELAEEGRHIEIQTCDAAQRSDVDAVVDKAQRDFGRIDTLVYAAGTNVPQRALTALSAASWQELLDANLTGAFHCTQAVLPTMRQASGGLIIYVSSAAVQIPDASGVAYQASKHGLNGLSLATRVEEKAHGIRTTLLCPGLCDTDILNRRLQPPSRETLNKALVPQDIADAILFLAGLPPRATVPILQVMPAQL
jgi:NADP-dependent 3-hydroxy acid dehydrogenase YdfG